MHDPDGLVSGYVHTLVDITRHKEAEAGIQRLVHADPLTGLANRILLDARVRQDLSRAHRAREPLALIILDVDRFIAMRDGGQLLEWAQVFENFYGTERAQVERGIADGHA